MSKAILTHAPGSIYDDLPEARYHFPRSYLNQVAAAVNDWIVYYEPRRGSDRAGRQAYFAVARVTGVREDPHQPDRCYADIADYLEFATPVPFRDGERYYESQLQKADGTTNRGAFGRSVRGLSDAEFEAILAAGFARELAPWERRDARDEAESPYMRPTVTHLVSRPFREQSFRHRVREAYRNRCAVTGLMLVNGGGRPEVNAAHVRPVAASGPDSVRNGVALTSTVHWLFDRGLIGFDDDYRVLVSPHGVPDELGRLVTAGQHLHVPDSPTLRPHRGYLAWHRDSVFKG